MAMHKPSDEISFGEFKELMSGFPSGHSAVIDEFKKILRSGCSEAEAKRWLMVHISEFPEGLRSGVMSAFAEETLEKAAEEEMERRFMEIRKTQGFFAALEWTKQQRTPH